MDRLTPWCLGLFSFHRPGHVECLVLNFVGDTRRVPFGVFFRATPVPLRGYRHLFQGSARGGNRRTLRKVQAFGKNQSPVQPCVPHRHAPPYFQTRGEPFSAQPPTARLHHQQTERAPAPSRRRCLTGAAETGRGDYGGELKSGDERGRKFLRALPFPPSSLCLSQGSSAPKSLGANDSLKFTGAREKYPPIPD